jgi:hypothetical protein
MFYLLRTIGLAWAAIGALIIAGMFRHTDMVGQAHWGVSQNANEGALALGVIILFFVFICPGLTLASRARR